MCVRKSLRHIPDHHGAQEQADFCVGERAVVRAASTLANSQGYSRRSVSSPGVANGRRATRFSCRRVVSFSLSRGVFRRPPVFLGEFCTLRCSGWWCVLHSNACILGRSGSRFWCAWCSLTRGHVTACDDASRWPSSSAPPGRRQGFFLIMQ
jgi:hypothetical protein